MLLTIMSTPTFPLPVPEPRELVSRLEEEARRQTDETPEPNSQAWAQGFGGSFAAAASFTSTSLTLCLTRQQRLDLLRH